MSGGHVARKTRMEALMSASSHQTPRSTSWTRSHHSSNKGSMTDRPARSVSVCRPKSKEAEMKEEEQREMARQAFQAWLERKRVEPRGPRASPSREQISKHLKDDKKQRVFNDWLHSKKFQNKKDMSPTATL